MSNVATHNNPEPDERHSEKALRYPVPLLHDPVCQVCEEEQTEKEESDNIEQSVDLVSRTLLRLTGYDQQLTSVKEDGIDLHKERESNEGHELFADDRDGVAEDDKRVVEEQLVGASFAMVEDHVSRVIEKVSDGEADEGMTALCEPSLQVVLHVRGLERERNVSGLSECHDIYLTEGCCRPGAGDDGVDEAGGHVPPLPSLLSTVGGCRWREGPREKIHHGKCCCPTENYEGHLTMSDHSQLPHSNAATTSTADGLQSPGGGKLGPVPLLLPTAHCSLLTGQTPLTTHS